MESKFFRVVQIHHKSRSIVILAAEVLSKGYPNMSAPTGEAPSIDIYGWDCRAGLLSLGTRCLL
jgi:hypothetical protein